MRQQVSTGHAVQNAAFDLDLLVSTANIPFVTVRPCKDIGISDHSE